MTMATEPPRKELRKKIQEARELFAADEEIEAIPIRGTTQEEWEQRVNDTINDLAKKYLVRGLAFKDQDPTLARGVVNRIFTICPFTKHLVGTDKAGKKELPEKYITRVLSRKLTTAKYVRDHPRSKGSAAAASESSDSDNEDEDEDEDDDDDEVEQKPVPAVRRAPLTPITNVPKSAQVVSKKPNTAPPTSSTNVVKSAQIASKKPTKAVTMAQKRTKQEEIERLKAQLAALEAWPQDESEDEPECKPAAQARPHIVMPPPLPMVSCGADSAKVVAPKLTGDAAEAPMPALKVAATPAEGALLPALKPTATPAEALLPATMPAPMVQPLRPVGPGIKTGAKGTKSRTGRPLPVDLGLQHFLNQVKPGVKVLPKPNNPMETVMVGAVIAQKFQYVPLQKTAPIEFGWELAEVYDVGKGDAEYPWKLCFVERSEGAVSKEGSQRSGPQRKHDTSHGKFV
eukprot:jgi/Mesvir1/5280/Mv15387-RA.1